MDYELISSILKGNTHPGNDRVVACKKRIQRYGLHLKSTDDPVLETGWRLVTQAGLLVPRDTEVEKIISAFRKRMIGSGARPIFHLLQEHYAGISYQAVQAFINSQSSQSRVHPTFDNKCPLVPVEAEAPMERIQIDLLDIDAKMTKLSGSTVVKKYCLVVLDVFSRFLWLRAISSKTPECVMLQLHDIFMEFGSPKCLQCDNGGEFKGILPVLCMKLQVKMVHGRPRHPQSQGKV